jgi:ParB family chromosome partitioning protein
MLTTKPLAFFKTDPNQPRKQFTEADLRSLGASMKSLGQLQPVGAMPDGTLLWGERRLRAAQLVGLKELQVIITDRKLSDSEIRLIQLTENMHRADLTAPEKSLSMVGLLELNPGWTNKELAAHLHLDPSSVTRYLAYRDGTAELQKAYLSEQIDLTRMYAIVKLPLLKQNEALALALSGASRDAIERSGRKNRDGQAAAVRLSRVKIAMPQGASVVVSGKELTMTDLVDLLGETLKEARKAAEQFDVKTFQAMMRDKARG